MDLAKLKGQAKLAFFAACFAFLCFLLGIGRFPLALFGILAGLSLAFLQLGRARVRSWIALVPLALYLGYGVVSMIGSYDAVSLLCCLFGFTMLLTVLILVTGGLGVIVVERDDVVLGAQMLTILSLISLVFAIAELIRGFSLGFSTVMLRIGAAAFWFSFSLYYLRAKRPRAVRAQPAPGSHPYEKPGGSLLIFLIGIYITAAALLLIAPLLISSSLDALKLLTSFDSAVIGVSASVTLGKWLLYLLIALSLLLLLCALVLLWLARKVRLKSPYFLLYFEYACLLISVISILTLLAGRHYLAAFLLLVALAAAVYGLMYFLCTSVRVRTYMGSDAYLRNAWFTKKLPSPTPADHPE